MSSGKMQNLYSKNVQKKHIEGLLGGLTKANGEVIITAGKGKNDFLAKGHLAPNKDFIHKELQDATFQFTNVAPQVSPPLQSVLRPCPVPVLQRQQLEAAGGGGEEGGEEVSPRRGRTPDWAGTWRSPPARMASLLTRLALGNKSPSS
jgi:hypothetical protein